MPYNTPEYYAEDKAELTRIKKHKPFIIAFLFLLTIAALFTPLLTMEWKTGLGIGTILFVACIYIIDIVDGAIDEHIKEFELVHAVQKLEQMEKYQKKQQHETQLFQQAAEILQQSKAANKQ